MSRTINKPNRHSSNSRVGSSALSLPTKPVKVSDNFFDYNHCIYGRKSIGKTTLASQFPKALNFRFERGRQNLAIYQVPEDKSKLLVWESFMEYLELFCEDDNYEYAVIDSVDACYDRAFEKVCRERNCTHPNQKKDYGETWGMITEAFTSAFDMIQDAGKKFVLLSHDKIRRFENPDGSELERTDLSMSPSAAGILKQRCECVLYYGYAENDRVITIRNDRNQVECAAGVAGRFLQPDGTPIRRFEMPNDPEKGMETVLKAWDNELWDYDYEPPREARPKKTKRR